MKATGSTRIGVWFSLGVFLVLLGAQAVSIEPSAARVLRSGPRAPHVEQVANAYLRVLTRKRQFSGSVLVAKDGRVMLQAGYGWASVARRIPNTPTTRFRIASITKQFTAMAILQLVQDGLLRFSDHVCIFIDACPATWAPITIQELLTHTSGLLDYADFPSYRVLSGTDLTPGQIIGLVATRRLRFPPGTSWRYSDTDYVLLGVVIQRLSGTSYARYLARDVLNPLGMTDTGYDTNHPKLPEHAVGYTDATLQPAAYINMSAPFAAGALESTVGDLGRWDDALMTGEPKLIGTALLRRMFRPWAQVNSVSSYGYGWFIELGGKEDVHAGGINGFISYNAIFPSARAAIVVLSNFRDSPVRGITDHLAKLYGLRACLQKTC